MGFSILKIINLDGRFGYYMAFSLHFWLAFVYYKLVMDQYENDLLSVANSLALSINEKDLHAANSGLCKASCIRFALVKLLRMSGYDAGLCTSKWQGSDKVPGGDHEYIDVVPYNDTGGTERVIIDIDFRSHFEIARAVDSYDRILNSLPVIYVGSFAKLKQYLQVMVEAARSSLKQNSMPLPPWRSLAYLQAKWQSPYQRKIDSAEQNCNTTAPADHKKCAGHLKRLHSLLLSEIEVERALKPYNRDNRRVKTERRMYLSFH
ncbi:cruciferin [Perilla frutescens var. hirtella]|nr:cruciferin [Perilla frutescens var. hirtella]